jgi:hypothetical protein
MITVFLETEEKFRCKDLYLFGNNIKMYQAETLCENWITLLGSVMTRMVGVCAVMDLIV